MKAVISVNTRYHYLANDKIPLGRSQGGFLEEVTLKLGPEELKVIHTKKAVEGKGRSMKKKQHCVKVTR